MSPPGPILREILLSHQKLQPARTYQEGFKRNTVQSRNTTRESIRESFFIEYNVANLHAVPGSPMCLQAPETNFDHMGETQSPMMCGTSSDVATLKVGEDGDEIWFKSSWIAA